MGNDLLNFLSLVLRENLLSCELEITRDRIDDWARPTTQIQRFDDFETFYDFICFTLEQDYTLLSARLNYDEGKQVYLDILMGKLLLKNSVNLISLDQLNDRGLLGNQRFVEQIQMEFI